MNRGSFLKNLILGGVGAVAINKVNANSNVQSQLDNAKDMLERAEALKHWASERRSNLDIRVEYEETLREHAHKVNETYVTLLEYIKNKKTISNLEGEQLRKPIMDMVSYAAKLPNNIYSKDGVGWDWSRCFALAIANTYVLEGNYDYAIQTIKNIPIVAKAYPFTFKKQYPKSALPQNCNLRESWGDLGYTFLQFDKKDYAIYCIEKSFEYGKSNRKKLLNDLKNNKDIKFTYQNPYYETFITV